MSGTIRPLGQHRVEVPPDSAVVVATLPAGTLAEDEILAFLWGPPGAPDQGDIHAPKPWKAYDLPATALTQTVKPSGTDWQITVETDAPAFFVALEADQPGRFSSNAFPLFPGYPATVTFTPDTPGQAPRFTLRDLRAATYGQT